MRYVVYVSYLVSVCVWVCHLVAVTARMCADGYVSWSGHEDVCSLVCQLVGLAVRMCAVGYVS